MSSLSVGHRSDDGPSPRAERDEFLFEMRELCLLVRRRSTFVMACAGLCVLAAVSVLSVRGSTYTGTAQLMLDPRGLNVVADQVVPESPSADVDDAIMDTEIRLLSSDKVLRAVVESLHLGRDPAYAGRPGLLARLGASLGLRRGDPTGPDPEDAAVAALRRQIAVQRDSKSFVVNVTARATAPDEAVRIVRATVNSFLAELVNQRRALVTRAQSAMEATLDGQRDRVAQAEGSVERYKERAGIIDADGRTLNIAGVTQLDSQILSAHAAAETLSARLAQLNGMRRRPDQLQDVDSPLLTQLRTSRTEVDRQRANLEASLGLRHPQVQEIEAQLKSLDRAVVVEIDRLIAAAKSDYLGAVQREQALVADRGRLEKRIAGTNTALVGMRQLEREAEAQRGVYEKFLGRERELREQESVSPVNATLIAGPIPSDSPAGAAPVLAAAAGSVLGILLGTALAWAFERWQGRVYSAGRLGARTGLPVIGMMPLAVPAMGGPPAVACALAGGRGTETSRAIQRLDDALDRCAGASSLLVLSATGSGAGLIAAHGVALSAAAFGHRTLLVEATARDAPASAPSRLALNTGVSSACKVSGFPSFDVERLEPSSSTGPSEGSMASWLAGRDRVVVHAGPDADNGMLRRLARAASVVVIVIEAGVSTYPDVDMLRDAVGGDDHVSGLLLAASGTDEVRVLPARITADLPRTDVLRAFRPMQT